MPLPRPDRLGRSARATLLAVLVPLVVASALVTGGSLASAEGPGQAPATQSGFFPFQIGHYRWIDRQEVRVYHNWSAGSCPTPGTSTAPAPLNPPVDAATMTALLTASLADINAALGGALTLVHAGEAPANEHCGEPSLDQAYDVVIGWSPMPSRQAGLAYVTWTTGDVAAIVAGRIRLSASMSWTCSAEPVHRGLQQTITHELLHTLGVEHSDDPNAVMYHVHPLCASNYVLQPDDIAALNTIYPPPAVAATPVPAPPTSTHALAGAIGLAITADATTAEGLIGEMLAGGCQAEVVAITIEGSWRVYVNGAPAFANAAFPASLAATTPYFYRCR